MILRVACRLDNSECCSLVGCGLVHGCPVGIFLVHGLGVFGRHASCSQAGTTSSYRRETTEVTST